jgi:hypothetical protein
LTAHPESYSDTDGPCLITGSIHGVHIISGHFAYIPQFNYHTSSLWFALPACKNCCEYSGNSCAIFCYTSKSSLIKQKHSLSTHSLHTYLHSIFTSPTTRLRSYINTTVDTTPNGTHTCPDATHAEVRTRTRSDCVGRHNGSLPSFRTERTIVGSIPYLGISFYSHGITPRESRSDAEHRIGIFSFLSALLLF